MNCGQAKFRLVHTYVIPWIHWFEPNCNSGVSSAVNYLYCPVGLRILVSFSPFRWKTRIFWTFQFHEKNWHFGPWQRTLFSWGIAYFRGFLEYLLTTSFVIRGKASWILGCNLKVFLQVVWFFTICYSFMLRKLIIFTKSNL